MPSPGTTYTQGECRRGEVLELGQERTKRIESSLLNLPEVAEGKGFERLDRLHGRRFSRPIGAFHEGRHSATPNQERPPNPGTLSEWVLVPSPSV